MADAWNQLRDAFVNDHRKLTSEYRHLMNALAARDFKHAALQASKLDRLAGAHIEFEERFLYTEAEVSHGDAYTKRLYDEHDEVAEALIQLQNLTVDTRPSEDQIAEWTRRIQTGLDHAASCAELLNRLQMESDHTHKVYLQSLQRLQKEGHRWTELRPVVSKSRGV